MSGEQTVSLAPSPAALMESLRSIGYSTETAIADIIDNSITAGAKNVEIFFEWNSGKPRLMIVDDGSGMTRDELINAMRFGSTGPLITRSANDLGRFGLGLKTASFSQCRHLIVCTKKENAINLAEWNLDKICRENSNEWQLRVFSPELMMNLEPLKALLKEKFNKFRSGTIVYWENIDKFDQTSSRNSEIAFNETMFMVREHLELVFHRFLEERVKKKSLTIFMNSDAISPRNPFFVNHNATQELPRQDFIVQNETIQVQPYILPHHSKVNKSEWVKQAGKEGHLHNQGFYVYRNRRLIISGTWFRLLKKEELNKLIRIKVDISNKLDHLWDIDIKKSRANPPEVIRQNLKNIIGKIEFLGRKVYRQRGRVIKSSNKIPVWNRRAANSSINFEVNRSHPYIKGFLEKLCSEDAEIFSSILDAIDTGLPLETLYHDYANNPEELEKNTMEEKELEELLVNYINLLKVSGNFDHNEILCVEPFASNKEAVELFLKKHL